MPTLSVPKFDSRIKPLYKEIHADFVIGVFKAAGYSVVTDESLDIGSTTLYFECKADGRPFVIDYADSKTIQVTRPPETPIFKFHYSKEEHSGFPNVHPWSPVSFYQWDWYELHSREIEYPMDGLWILNNQRAYGNAIERRTRVQNMLVHNLNYVETRILPQDEFWRQTGKALVYVHVGGNRPDILDRANLQMTALGCPWIATHVDTWLAGGSQLSPKNHYFKVKDDWSDLLEMIEHVRSNRQEAWEKAQAGKKFFRSRLTPKPLTEWIEARL